MHHASSLYYRQTNDLTVYTEYGGQAQKPFDSAEIGSYNGEVD